MVVNFNCASMRGSQRDGAVIGGGSGMFIRTGACSGGGGGESGGTGGGYCER